MEPVLQEAVSTVHLPTLPLLRSYCIVGVYLLEKKVFTWYMNNLFKLYIGMMSITNMKKVNNLKDTWKQRNYIMSSINILFSTNCLVK